MRRLLLMTLLALTVFLPTRSPALDKKDESDAGLTAAVRRAEDQRIAAMIKADLAALDTLLAEELTYTHSNGRVETKAQFLAALKSGDLRYEAIDREDLTVRSYGETAVFTGRATLRVKSKGQENRFLVRFIDVYVKRNGRWQMVAWQSTRLGNP